MTTKDSLQFVVVGHVDHGKSTLIGRLLSDTDSITKSALEKVRKICMDSGKQFEYAFLLDAFEEEQQQGITIDTTNIRFKSKKREYTIIDAPGHTEFLKNMISGASHAQAAILIVDADEGVMEQTKRHAYMLSLLGITQVFVVINKMDLIEYSQDRFVEVKRDVEQYLLNLGIHASKYIPLSAFFGENMIEKSSLMPWYTGPTVLEGIDSFTDDKNLIEKPLRLPIQDVYKFDTRRIVAGKVESGSFQNGDEVIIYPSRKKATIKSIEDWPMQNQNKKRIVGECVGITLNHEFFLKRGEVISHINNQPESSTLINCSIFWIGKENLSIGKKYTIKINSQEVSCVIKSINKIIDSNSLHAIQGRDTITQNEVGEVTIRTEEPVVFDTFSTIAQTGRFVLVDDYEISGGGIILESLSKSTNVVWQKGDITHSDRIKNIECNNKVIWLTGLSGSGKSTVAKEIEKELHMRGYPTYILDGDNIRHGLSKDLGFSKYDREENIRRISEVAKLFHDAGIFVIVSFISPFKKDRDCARQLIGDDFVEVYVNCSLEECERRDVKGLYQKARKGEIMQFTGISSPYEEPVNPEIIIDTENTTSSFCALKVVENLNIQNLKERFKSTIQ